MKYLGVDYGKKRIGVAISDEDGLLAFPEAVFVNNESVIEHICAICTSHSITTIVIGESKNFKGEENHIMKDARSFADELSKKGHIVVYEPEILSTVQAEQIQGKKDDIDASAAAIILQSYLDRQQFKNKDKEDDQKDKYTLLEEMTGLVEDEKEDEGDIEDEY